MTKNRYVIAEGSDGTFWVSLQPLIMDIQERRDHARQHSTESTVYAMESVHAFLHALLSEALSAKYQRQRERDTELPYKDTLQ
jgi:hypothetical protein